MPKIITPDDIGVEEFVSLLRDRETIVYEDVQGSKIWVDWDGMNWNIRPKSASAEPINMVDLAMQKFYNKAYLYFATMPESVTTLVNKRWKFCFEYFCDEQPANVRYSKLPKNNLILTCIHKGGKKFSYDADEIGAYAQLFDVDRVPLIYRGRLSERQIQLVNKYLHTSENDLEFLFKEVNFARFFYNLLNPAVQNSFLMRDGEFQDNLEKVVVRFAGVDGDLSFQILNPLYTRSSANVDTDYLDVYSVILLNFLQFMQGVDLNAVKLSGTTSDALFIELSCKLFNMYMQQSANDLLKLGVTVPSFFAKDKFKINRDMIDNPVTLEWMNKNPRFEYVFKVILSSLQKEKKKPFGIFTERTVEVFNGMVKAVFDRVKVQISRNIELDVYRDRLLSFAEFQELKDELDASGRPYLNKPGKSQAPDYGKKKGFVKKK